VSLFKLIVAEIRHRLVACLVATFVVAGVVFCLAATFASLRAFDAETDARLFALQHDTDQRMQSLENKIRKTMKGLGFNIHIYPASQNISKVYEQGYATETMPESYVDKLAQTDLLTVNHLLPRLSQRLVWKEQQRTIILIGIKGQVPISHKSPKKPIMEPVEKGHVVLGYELYHSTGLKVGDRVTLNGYPFTISKTHPQRGTLDDITAWIPLQTAQEMLHKPNQINAILALGCNCTTVDRLGEIRQEIQAILPEVQVIEVESKALARAETRNRVARDAKKALDALVETRAAARAERTRFTRILLPLVVIAGFIGIAALSFLNTRVREGELGTLRALGFSTWKIAGLVLGRALIIGCVGSLLGISLAWLLTPSMIGARPTNDFFIKIALAAPLLTLASAWLPAFDAMQRDPINALRHD